MMSRMLIRGAHVVDPSQGIDGIMDIELAQGRIARLGQGLTAANLHPPVEGMTSIATFVLEAIARAAPDLYDGRAVSVPEEA